MLFGSEWIKPSGCRLVTPQRASGDKPISLPMGNGKRTDSVKEIGV
jgi:hypothetical protein